MSLTKQKEGDDHDFKFGLRNVAVDYAINYQLSRTVIICPVQGRQVLAS